MINPTDIQIDELPSVSLSEKSKLPCTPSIYFAVNPVGNVLYIGRSKNPKSRWTYHQCYESLVAVGGCRIFYVHCPVSLLHEVEQALISHFDPPMNIRKPVDAVEPAGGAVINTIKEFVDAQGITPYQFRKDVGIAQRTAYDLYNNPLQLPSSSVLTKICDCYEIQPSILLKWIPKTEREAMAAGGEA